MRFRGATALFYVFLLGLMVPLEATIVPLYFDLRDLGLTDTYWALILPQVGVSVAFGTFWMRAFFRSSPRSLVEAARIDGASSWTTLWRVLVPFGAAGDPHDDGARLHVDLERVPARARDGLRREPAHRAARARVLPGPHTSDFTLLAAGAVIVATPVVLVYVFLQRHFIRGMLTGAVKG